MQLQHGEGAGSIDVCLASQALVHVQWSTTWYLSNRETQHGVTRLQPAMLLKRQVCCVGVVSPLRGLTLRIKCVCVCVCVCACVRVCMRVFGTVLFQYRVCAFSLVIVSFWIQKILLVQFSYSFLILQNFQLVIVSITKIIKPLTKRYLVIVISENRQFSVLVQLWFLLVCSWIFQLQFPAQQKIFNSCRFS